MTEYVPVPERLARGTELIQKRLGVTIRPLDMSRFDEEVGHIKRLYNAAWEKNWGFVPMTEAEIDHLAEQLKPVVIPELVPFVEKDGKVIGFGVTLPDLNTSLKKHNGGLIGAVRGILSVKLRRMKRLRILLLGIVPELRGKGIDAMLYQWIWTKAGARGITWGEAGWILEDNPAMNAGLEKMTFRVYKTYRLYDRAL
jgi:GNAT superfamily N-acetyltransferase